LSINNHWQSGFLILKEVDWNPRAFTRSFLLWTELRVSGQRKIHSYQLCSPQHDIITSEWCGTIRNTFGFLLLLQALIQSHCTSQWLSLRKVDTTWTGPTSIYVITPPGWTEGWFPVAILWTRPWYVTW